MSTLKSINVIHPSSATNNIVNDASGNVAIGNNLTVTGTVVMGSSFKRNRIINGNMLIDQRNAGASLSVSANGTNYGVDRTLFFKDVTSLAVLLQQSTTAPTGFTNSLGVTVTAAATPTGSQEVILQQNIEGYNISDLSYGSAAAKNTVLSFWVRSSITGTYCIAIRNSAFNRTYLAEYTVSAANTFEYKTISIPGDTSGTWLTDNGVGIRVLFCLGSSSTSGSASSWQTGSFTRTANQVNWCATSAATFYITGVQLEVGTVATPYEMQIYSDQLAQCQRYFYKNGGSNAFQSHGVGSATAATTVDIDFTVPVVMRTAPVLTVNNIASMLLVPLAATPSSVVIQDAPSTNSTHMLIRANTTGATIGSAQRLYSNNNVAATLDFSAEL